MVARAVDDARTRLRDLRVEEWEEGAVAAAALALAIVASTLRRDLAVPLFLGGIFVGARALLTAWRRWDLVDRLLAEPDAYTIPDVRERAQREASMSNRRVLSTVIRRRLELADDPRVTASADALASLADELEDRRLELDPRCAVACSRLLTDYETSPLVNPALPAEDVRSRIVQIRAGFHPRTLPVAERT